MPTDLQRAIDGLAHQLGRSVAVDDARMRLVAHSPHVGPVDAARLGSLLNREVPSETIQWAHSLGVAQAQHALRLPSNPALGFEYPRVGVPIRSGGVLLGYLWIIDPDSDMTEADVDTAQRCATETGAIMHRDQLLEQMRADQETQLVTSLVSPDEEVRATACRRAAELALLPSSHPITVVVVRARTDAPETETELALVSALESARRRPRFPSWLQSTVGDKAVALVPTPSGSPSAARDIADQLCDALAAVAGAARGGVGEPTSLASVVDSYHQATDALTIGERTASPARVLVWREQGAYRLLSRLPDTLLAAEALHPGVELLLQAEGSDELVQTLECYLDFGGAVKESAAALFMHRGSLYHRLARIERITGTSLSNGDDRLSMHLGIKAARLLGRVSVAPVTPYPARLVQGAGGE
jgi:sugar diacid utilization regulator